MLHSALGYRGAMSAPHRAAAQSGLSVLEEGGTAVEAMVAAAATIAVCYPHMNGIGGDGFWLIKRAGGAPVGIFAGGPAAGLATVDWMAARGVRGAMPTRGPLAATTVPGTVAGWDCALGLVERPMPLARLLRDAVAYARDGVAVSGNLAQVLREKAGDLAQQGAFAEVYLPGGQPPLVGARLRQEALARCLEALSQEGLRSFYEGEIAQAHAAALEAAGSPLRFDDFARFQAREVEPLTLSTSMGQLYNMTAPTQGVSSLMILGLFDRLAVDVAEGRDHIHGIVEATKRAFLLRNKGLGDPSGMVDEARDWLTEAVLAREAAAISMENAAPWPHPARDGDTIWMGAVDQFGTAVSFIQSVYWEFGSGVMCPETGVVFQNRGAGFSLLPGPNQLTPGRVPFHTLNPALAELPDGRVMAYGTMGGEGQPQTQAAIFTRYAKFGQGLQQAVSAPRWLLGRTWGDEATALRIEDRFDGAVMETLSACGHEVTKTAPFSDIMGHAGALVRHPTGLIEAAADPRADGVALAF